MMIIGKFFKTCNDYINIMKVCKRYEQLTQMYHFNPISDISLFENMETQYLYNEKDNRYRKEFKRHVYWYEVKYRLVKKTEMRMMNTKELN